MESTLNYQWSLLQAEVGTFLGFRSGNTPPYTDPAWTPFQAQRVDSCVKAGLARFYYPKPLDGQTKSYDWSFLRPVAILNLPQGTNTIPLPDDFGGFDGQLTVQSNSVTTQPWRIEWQNEGRLRLMISGNPSMTGPPMYAAQEPTKGTTATASSRANLVIYPTADQTYNLQATYYIHPDYLSGAFPYAYGGPQHAETILEACLAVAEERMDDARTTHRAAFEERLATSMSLDRRNKEQKLGYNGDRSDVPQWMRSGAIWHWWAPPATYNGQGFS